MQTGYVGAYGTIKKKKKKKEREGSEKTEPSHNVTVTFLWERNGGTRKGESVFSGVLCVCERKKRELLLCAVIEWCECCLPPSFPLSCPASPVQSFLASLLAPPPLGRAHCSSPSFSFSSLFSSHLCPLHSVTHTLSLIPKSSLSFRSLIPSQGSSPLPPHPRAISSKHYPPPPPRKKKKTRDKPATVSNKTHAAHRP